MAEEIVINDKINVEGDSSGAQKELEDLQNTIKQTEREIKRLGQKMLELDNVVNSAEEAGANRLAEQARANLEKTTKEYEQAVQKLESLQGKMETPVSEEPAQKTSLLSSVIGGLVGKLTDLGMKLGDMKSASDEGAKGMDKFRLATESINGIAKKVSSTIFSLANIFKMMAMRMIMSALRSDFSGAMNELIRTSNSAKSAFQSLQVSASRLTGSIIAGFAPLANMIAPIFDKITSAIVGAMNALSRFLALLSGKSSYTKAVVNSNAVGDAMQGAGSSAKEASKDELEAGKNAKKTAEEQKRALASFDEINQLNLQEDKDESDSGSNPKTPSGSGGGGAGSAISFVEESIGEPSEFLLELSEKLRTIWENILRIAEALAEAWRKAWEYNGNGEAILQALKDILFIILDTIITITDHTAEWAEKLDLIPLVTGIRDVLEALVPVIQIISDALIWIWDNVILPLAGWLAESVLPLVLENIASILEIIRATLELIGEEFQPIWDNWIQPLAEDIGQIITDTLAEWNVILQDILTWISEHQEVLEFVLTVLLGIVTAIVTLNTVMTLTSAIITTVTTLASLFGSGLMFLINSPLALIVVAIGVLIGILSALGISWEDVKNIADRCWKHITEFVNNAVKKIGEGLDSMKTKAKSVINSIIGFTEKGINGAISAVENFLNWILEGLDKLISAINSLGAFFGMDLGIGGLGRLTLPRVSLPRLATGTVVPPNAGEFMAILGDNNSDTEVVSPLETMKEAMIEALQESGRSNQQIVIKFDGSLSQLARILKPALEDEDGRIGTVIVEGV